MNLITPFSGLSLIVHLFIIIFIKLFAFSKKRINFSKLKVLKSKNINKILFISKKVISGLTSKTYFAMSFSLVIILTISTFVSFSTYFAIKTGLREGEDEIHRKFFASRYDSFVENRKNLKSPVVTIFHNNFK